ncbi:unnamed protein product [Prorocentrum cordatum]|uniref:V-type proton ATPase subunit G n=1 Tax=Prorocentrum cordatum TaxID=2364126 RepID=A0ABN9QSD9_9DINO|nr:unnamed protein product [Polarella glacialis]
MSSSFKQVSGAAVSAVENAELAECRSQAAAALLSRKADIVKQRTSDRLETIFTARAQRAEAEAETVLQEALDAPGTMDEASLAEFRQRYIGLKMQKHTRLALKELAGPPPHARRSAGEASADRPGLPRAASAGLERLKQGHQWSSSRSSSSEWRLAPRSAPCAAPARGRVGPCAVPRPPRARRAPTRSAGGW